MAKLKETDKKATNGSATKFRLNMLYVKDISFENPLSPGVFLKPVEKPEININVDIGLVKLQDNTYEVGLKINARASEPGGKALFHVELIHAGLFSINPELPLEQHDKTLLVDCASVIFPFARRVIADLVQEGGFPQLLLEPINFESIYDAKRKAA